MSTEWFLLPPGCQARTCIALLGRPALHRLAGAPSKLRTMSCLALPLAANPWIPAQVQPAGLHRGAEQR